MPEREKVRSEIARQLLGGVSFLNGVSQGDSEATWLRALEIADQIYRMVANMDLQRTLMIARATHQHQCVAPAERREQWKHDDCCGYCLREALLSLDRFNMGRHVHSNQDEHDLSLARIKAQAEEANGWVGGEHLSSGGWAEELTLMRYAQRSGAAMLISGPENVSATVQLRHGQELPRAVVIQGLRAGIQRSQQEIDRLTSLNPRDGE